MDRSDQKTEFFDWRGKRSSNVLKRKARGGQASVAKMKEATVRAKEEDEAERAKLWQWVNTR
jgi:hypothetical protein